MRIKDIVNAIEKGHIRITDNADEEAHSDNLTFEQIIVSIQKGEIIEEYPTDKPFPSYLIFGTELRENPFIQCGRIITTINGLSL